MARRTRGFTRPAPRTKIWIGSGIGSLTIVGSSTVIVSSLSAAALLLRPFTVLRTRMLIGFESDQQVISEIPQGSYGKIVVTKEASDAGAASIPDPSTSDGDPDADWFVHQECLQSFLCASDVGIATNAAAQYVVDSKAMRKVGPNDDLVAMFSETSGVGAILTTRGRQLIQLH